MPALDAARSKKPGFKNRDKDMDDFRRRRADCTVELRKARKDEQILKKRNCSDMSFISPLKENNQQTPTPLLPLEEIIEVLLNEVNPSDDKIYQAVQSTRRLLSREKNPPIDLVIKSGLVPPLVKLLDYESNTGIQFEAEWAVTNIASGTSEQTKTVVDHGAVQCFVTLLLSNHAQVCEQAVWALGNIAGDGPMFRDHVISCGAVEPLLSLIKQNTPYPFLRNVTWTISNLCRNKNPPPDLNAISAVLPALALLITHPDGDVISDACWALSYLTDGPNEKINIIIETNVVPRLVELLSDPNVAIVTPALRAIGNIVTGDDHQTQHVVEHGALPRLKNLFFHTKSQIVKEAAWAVSNVAAGNQQQIQALIDHQLLEPVINALDKGEFKVQKEAIWVITNFTSGGSVEQIVELINRGVLGPLCRFLETREPKTVMVTLDAINHILMNAERMNKVEALVDLIDEADGVKTLHALAQHENDSISKVANNIIEVYFGNDDQDDEDMILPESIGQTYQFGATTSAMPNFNI